MNMFTSSKAYSATTLNSAIGNSVWLIVSLILAIIGGILVYFLFLSKKNEGKFTGFLGWMYDFLSFKKMFLETLLKITYLIFAIYVTLSSFAIIGVNFLGFLITLVVGNLVVRIAYEFSLILLVICRNTSEIARNTKKIDDNK